MAYIYIRAQHSRDVENGIVDDMVERDQVDRFYFE
jgi:hypothetical protein